MFKGLGKKRLNLEYIDGDLVLKQWIKQEIMKGKFTMQSQLGRRSKSHPQSSKQAAGILLKQSHYEYFFIPHEYFWE